MIPFLLLACLSTNVSLVVPEGSPVINQEEITHRSSRLAARIKCPVCQGQSVADSQTQPAIEMLAKTEELIAEGYTDEQIEAWFVDKYGQWILLKPPVQGHHLALWFSPVVFLLGGALIVLMTPQSQIESLSEKDIPKRDIRKLIKELEQ